MKVVLSPRAQRQCKKLANPFQKGVLQHINQLANNPFPSQSKKLSGHNGFRLRYRNHRIIYHVDSKRKLITIMAVAHRKIIYKLV